MTAAEMLSMEGIDDLDLARERIERARVVRIAREWLGTPYHHRARIKGVGADCGQLLAGVFEEAGLIPDVPIEVYPRDWMMHRSEPRFQRSVEQYFRQVERAPRSGDVLLFTVGRCFSHGAIVLDYPIIAHAVARPVGKVVMSSMEQEAALRRRLAGVWAHKGWS